jgi:MoxR-like ATPase
MFSVEIDYPSFNEELSIASVTTGKAQESINAVLHASDIAAYCDLVRRMPVAESVVKYAVTLARKTRPLETECPQTLKDYIAWGAGPRASQYLLLAAKSYAALDGRPTPDVGDVKRASPAVLRHRIVRSFQAETDGVSANEIVKRLVES